LSIVQNNNNASISTAQNKLSSVALMAVQTYTSLVFRQNNASEQQKSVTFIRALVKSWCFHSWQILPSWTQ